MRLLHDRRKVKHFIENGAECPTVPILEFYIDCKMNDLEVPQNVDDFVTTCLKEVIKQYNQGSKPDYDDIFKLDFGVGAKGRSEIIKRKRELVVGAKVANLRDDNIKYDTAIDKVANEFGLTTDTVKKLYSAFKKAGKLE